LQQTTVAYFEPQRIYNRVVVEGFHPLQQIEDLHYLLTSTSLQWLPLWVLGLGNHPIQNHVQDMPNDGSGQVEYVRGLLALSRRDFREAARNFGLSELQGRAGVRSLLVYSLCLAGESSTAAKLSQNIDATDGDLRHFWGWMRARFGVGPA
jgi:hypothetical protein